MLLFAAFVGRCEFPKKDGGPISNQTCRKRLDDIDLLVKSYCPDSIMSHLQQVKKDLDEKFRVPFLGCYSVGKSTLINSLAGEKVCATGFEPTTGAVTSIDIPGANWIAVDSPGLDAIDHEEHKEEAMEAARRSNVAVFVEDATRPFSNAILPLIKEVSEAHANVVIVLNKWNRLETEEERNACMKYVNKVRSQKFPGKNIPVFQMDARSRTDKQFQALKLHLINYVNENEYVQKLQSGLAAEMRAIKTAKEGLERKKDDLTQKFEREEERKQSEMEKIRNEIDNEVERRSRVHANIVKTQTEIQKLEKSRRGFREATKVRKTPLFLVCVSLCVCVCVCVCPCPCPPVLTGMCG